MSQKQVGEHGIGERNLLFSMLALQMDFVRRLAVQHLRQAVHQSRREL
jgi:hypothetical protein